MRLFCVGANRKTAVVSTNFSAVFSFVTCVRVRKSTNGFVESRRKSNQVCSEGQGLNKRSRLDNLFLSTELIM